MQFRWFAAGGDICDWEQRELQHELHSFGFPPNFGSFEFLTPQKKTPKQAQDSDRIDEQNMLNHHDHVSNGKPRAEGIQRTREWLGESYDNSNLGSQYAAKKTRGRRTSVNFQAGV